MKAKALKDLASGPRFISGIYVKLCRAIEGKASEELETNEELKSFPKDSDGSAKIAIGRSIAAWSSLRTKLGSDEHDAILDLFVRLASIRRHVEELFPRARFFVRPGFGKCKC